MQPPCVVVTLDESEQVGAGVRARAPGRGRGTFELQRREEALGDGVVPAISLAAHALHRADLGEELSEALGREFRAAVGVEDQARPWLTPSDCAPQRVAGQLCIEPVSYRPANHLAREQVEDDYQEE